MTSFGLTDVGKKRTDNEDCIFLSETPIGDLANCFIVADGMGGHKAGEIASKMSINFFMEYLQDISERDSRDIISLMGAALAYANGKVYEQSGINPDYAGMGTTFTACVISDAKAHITHIGDSRLYLFRAGELNLLTVDHSLVNEMFLSGQITADEVLVHPKKNIITKALGISDDLDAYTAVEPLLDGDIIMMCSDGLSNMLSDLEIIEIINKNAPPCDKCKELIALANENGGDDNISVIILEI